MYACSRAHHIKIIENKAERQNIFPCFLFFFFHIYILLPFYCRSLFCSSLHRKKKLLYNKSKYVNIIQTYFHYNFLFFIFFLSFVLGKFCIMLSIYISRFLLHVHWLEPTRGNTQNKFIFLKFSVFFSFFAYFWFCFLRSNELWLILSENNKRKT